MFSMYHRQRVLTSSSNRVSLIHKFLCQLGRQKSICVPDLWDAYLIYFENVARLYVFVRCEHMNSNCDAPRNCICRAYERPATGDISLPEWQAFRQVCRRWNIYRFASLHTQKQAETGCKGFVTCCQISDVKCISIQLAVMRNLVMHSGERRKLPVAVLSAINTKTALFQYNYAPLSTPLT